MEAGGVPPGPYPTAVARLLRGWPWPGRPAARTRTSATACVRWPSGGGRGTGPLIAEHAASRGSGLHGAVQLPLWHH
jgi:hypothetical protein